MAFSSPSLTLSPFLTLFTKHIPHTTKPDSPLFQLLDKPVFDNNSSIIAQLSIPEEPHTHAFMSTQIQNLKTFGKLAPPSAGLATIQLRPPGEYRIEDHRKSDDISFIIRRAILLISGA